MKFVCVEIYVSLDTLKYVKGLMPMIGTFGFDMLPSLIPQRVQLKFGISVLISIFDKP